MIPYYIFTVQVLVSVVHEQPISLQLARHLKFARLAIEKWLMETLLLSRDCVTDITSVSVPENDLESDLVKLNANDSAYYCSISNILRYNYP